MIKISREKLVTALSDAGTAHHEYQQVIFNGAKDKYWPEFYAAFVIGCLGNIVKPSTLT